jgi:hypothetical protein
MKHLRQHPEAPHYAAASKVRISLLAAFPAKIQTEALPKLQRSFS